MDKVEEMKEFLDKLVLSQEQHDSLFKELDKSKDMLAIWKDYKTKEDWKELAGKSAGQAIYNYLHPIEGIQA